MNPIELSIVMPCLNEAETLESCLRKAFQSLHENHIAGEIIVADNGSEDDSVAIAARMGARVIPVAERGYGNALMRGIAAAQGRFILMGDADDSYDFLQIPRFLSRLREGYDLVQGCRLRAGGGIVLPAAMPPLHRWIGNPMLTLLVRFMFRSPLNDVYCGLRAFSAVAYQRLDLRCTGMEFATEMIVKASLFQLSIAEVPITLHPDGRITRRPHLRTFRDGWRTLRFYLLYSPRWLFLLPGLALILFGLAAYVLVYLNLPIAGAILDAHTLLFASLFILMGHQSVLFAISSRTFAVSEHLLPSNPALERFSRIFTLERGLLLGLLGMLLGSSLLTAAVHQWYLQHFGPLNYSRTMRLVIPGVTLVAIGFQTVLSSFFVSILNLRRK